MKLWARVLIQQEAGLLHRICDRVCLRLGRYHQPASLEAAFRRWHSGLSSRNAGCSGCFIGGTLQGLQSSRTGRGRLEVTGGGGEMRRVVSTRVRGFVRFRQAHVSASPKRGHFRRRVSLEPSLNPARDNCRSGQYVNPRLRCGADGGQTTAFAVVRSGSLTMAFLADLRKRTTADTREPLPAALAVWPDHRRARRFRDCHTRRADRRLSSVRRPRGRSALRPAGVRGTGR